MFLPKRICISAVRRSESFVLWERVRGRKRCSQAQFVSKGSQMGEASQKLKPANKHPEHLELQRFEFTSAALCLYMYMLDIIMNMIIIEDNL